MKQKPISVTQVRREIKEVIWAQAGNLLREWGQNMPNTLALFIYPAKSYFFVRLQMFLHNGCDFLPPEELLPHAKNDECGY